MKLLFYSLLFSSICFATSGFAKDELQQAQNILSASEHARANLELTNNSNIAELEKQITIKEYHLQKIVNAQQKLQIVLSQRQKNLAGTLLALQKLGFNRPNSLLLMATSANENLLQKKLHSAILLDFLYENYQQQFFSIKSLMEKLTNNSNAIIANKKKLLVRLQELASEQEKLDFLLGKLENELENETVKKLARLQQARTILLRDKNSNFITGETIIATSKANNFVADNLFTNLKNSLSYPVVGDIYYNFGSKNSQSGKNENMAFLAHSGSFVRAIADGLVIFAGEFRSYNNMVILDVGGGYFMIFTNMAKVAVELGDVVAAGDIIGRMGFEKTSDKLLQVELRYDNIAIDISAWLAKSQ